MVWSVVKSYKGHITEFYVVPKSWLYEFEGQTFVYYPSADEFKDITKEVIKKTKHSTSWKDWPAEVLPHDFDTFLAAKNIEAEVAGADKLAWNRYKTNGIPTEFGVGKRLVKKPKKLAEKSTTEYDSDSSENDSTMTKRVAMESPPKKPPSISSPVKRQIVGANDAPYQMSNPADVAVASNGKNKISCSPLKGSGTKPTKTNIQSSESMTVSHIKKIRAIESPNKEKTPHNPTKKARAPESPSKKVRAPESPSKKVRAPENPSKKVRAPESTVINRNKPSTSKATVDYMPTPKTVSVDANDKTVAWNIERVLTFDDTGMQNALESGVETNLPVVANGSNSGTRKTTLEEWALFTAKKCITIEKKLDRVLDHMERTSNLEGQLKFALPCKDYKRVLFVDSLLTSDKTQYDLLVRVLTHQPNTASRVGSMVNVMLRYLMTDVAAKKFCFTGSAKKYDFQSTSFSQGIIDAVLLMKKTDNISVDNIGKAIAAWLSQAKKRIQNRSSNQAGNKVAKKQKKTKPKNLEDLLTSQSEEDN